MNLITLFFKPVMLVLVGLLMAQWLPPSEVPPDTRDDFTAQTTPPLEFQIFNQDFASMDIERILDWLHPDYGLVKDGVLLTYDEAVEAFREEYSGDDINALNLIYNYGEIAGANHFQADCWVEWQSEIQGEETWLRFHHQFVFKIIDQRWYLVQSEFLPGEPSLAYDYQTDPNAPDWTNLYRSNVSEASLSGIGAWPLLIGTTYGTGNEIHPLEGSMFNGSKWTLYAAVLQDKPTVMFFLSITSGLVQDPEIFDSQLDYLAGLYDEFGLQDLYIFAVSDDLRERFEMLADDGHDNYVPLIDETSQIHATLNISEHPYIVVFDSQGTVIALSKTWHPSSHELISTRIAEVLAAAESD